MATNTQAAKSSIINHVLFILDRSGSMERHKKNVIKVFDNQIAHLAKRSQELDQETRVTVFQFGSDVECLIYDKDVLRLPSLEQLYRIDGMTALIAATIEGITDLRMTPEKYGDHAFIAYVLTDGAENESHKAPFRKQPHHLQQLIADLPKNWTVAALVPDQGCADDAERFGFPKENIGQWDATSDAGLQKAMDRIRTVTDTFMTGRKDGIRRLTNVFTMDLSKVNKTAVKSALTEVSPASYILLQVDTTSPIREFVERKLPGVTYGAGMGFYQLMKPETIQDYKNVFVREKATGKVYGGDAARQVLGLPDQAAKITPVHMGAFDVFIQSTSYNRKLIAGTQMLVLKP